LLFKTIVFLFMAGFIVKVLFFRKREKMSRIANQFANMFLVAIGIYIVVYGLIQIL
jgi:hypothetical protein